MVSNQKINDKLSGILALDINPLSNEIEDNKKKLEKIKLEKLILEENKIYLILILLIMVSSILFFICIIKLSI